MVETAHSRRSRGAVVKGVSGGTLGVSAEALVSGLEFKRSNSRTGRPGWPLLQRRNITTNNSSSRSVVEAPRHGTLGLPLLKGVQIFPHYFEERLRHGDSRLA